MNLKESLIDGLKSIGSFDVKIADAQEAIPHAIVERAPSRMFPEAKSVVVFVTAIPGRLLPHAFPCVPD